MKHINHISIPQTCNQNWDNMLPNVNGKYCDRCQKSVTDFSGMTNAEVINILSSTTSKVCGRFNETQLLILNSEIAPQATTVWWQKLGLAAALMAAVPFVNVQAKIPHLTEQIPIKLNNHTIAPKTDTTYKIVTGQITASDDKQALPGVMIKIKGGNKATATNSSGYFSIQVPVQTDVVLTVSFVGYQTQEVKIKAGDTPVYHLQLQVTAMMLGEVVVMRPPVWKRPYYAVKRMIRRMVK